MVSFRAIWELMRLEHGVMIFLGILIGAIIGLNGRGFPPFDNLFLTFFTALFLEASTFALNDYFDLEIDKQNERFDRPLVRGDISKRGALILFYVFFPLGLISSFFVNYVCFIIALITGFFAVFYDVYLKKKKVFGNFYIAYVMAIPFVFGGVSVLEENVFSLDINPAIFVLAFIAFLAGSGREIMKDIMDFHGDKNEGVKSFPYYVGIRNSCYLASFFYLAAVFLSFIPFFFQFFTVFYRNLYFMIFIIITDILLVYISLNLISKKNVHIKKFRKISLYAMFIALLGFLIGALVS